VASATADRCTVATSQPKLSEALTRIFQQYL
jgi:hypothetical protein